MRANSPSRCAIFNVREADFFEGGEEIAAANF